MSNSSPKPTLGVFVGGRSRRMGRPKGLLHAPAGEETLVERLVRLGGEAGLEVVLVGDAAPYASLVPEVPRLPDSPAGVGPLGGLRALLREHPWAIAIACDMPAVDRRAIEALRDADPAPVVAPRRRFWEPLCARYEAAAVLPLIDQALRAGELSLQCLLRQLEPVELSLAPETLEDWDRPEDLPRSSR